MTATATVQVQNPDMTKFEDRLSSFVLGCQEIINTNHTFTQSKPALLTVERGSRYIKLNRTNDGGLGQMSVHVFVDRRNGDVLKAASFKAPAKHARGNIFDDHNGLNRMSVYGAEYLR